MKGVERVCYATPKWIANEIAAGRLKVQQRERPK
jgi:hypothetical protein